MGVNVDAEIHMKMPKDNWKNYHRILIDLPNTNP